MMYPSLAGRVALVTAAGAGIGRAIAIRLGHEGCVVAANDLRPEAVATTLEMLAQAGVESSGWPGDMTDATHVARVVEGVAATHGGLDILVNNVGLFTFGDLATLDPAGWDACLDINAKSAFLCARAAAPFLRRPGGVILNMSSGAGKIGGTGAGAYSAAKWAVIGLTRSLAAELAPDIRVNAVCPGIIATEMDANYVARAAAAAGLAPERYDADRLGRIPLHRTGTAEDVAKAAAFLCSDEASYTTGEAFNVSGGMVMH
jgi:NAD(P)-dependent dehydrogenase (short-subunit alcohol dehydrogenase family)